MMDNLFTIFDPSTNNFIELNWISSISNMLLLPMIYWIQNSRIIKLFKLIMNSMHLELKNILSPNFNTYLTLYFLSLFMFIFLNNFLGLFPYIFTASSHMIFSLAISLPLWISLMLFGWINNTNLMFYHMVPSGTPYILMPFMVLIETISNIIRPSTLSIRLTANMIAGHLLITLMSESAQNSSSFTLISIIILLQMTLLTLEFSVSIIQSYVFTILSTLYSKETN